MFYGFEKIIPAEITVSFEKTGLLPFMANFLDLFKDRRDMFRAKSALRREEMSNGSVAGRNHAPLRNKSDTDTYAQIREVFPVMQDHRRQFNALRRFEMN